MRKVAFWLKLILRANGVFGVMALPFALLPQRWLAWCVALVEPQVADSFLVSYLAKFVSAYYVLLGTLMLVFAGDLARYRIAIRWLAIWIILAVLCLIAGIGAHVDTVSDQPLFWFIIFDGAYGLATAVAILLLQRKLHAQPTN